LRYVFVIMRERA